MKQRDKYFLVLMIFLMIMVLVLSYFYNRYNNTGIVNESKELLGDIYSLKSGEYELKNGLLFNSNKERVNDKEYIKASGIIYVDKYLNVRFKLNIDNSCISKTSLGNIKFEKNHCTDYKKIIIDPCFIDTLSKDDYLNGWGEILKFSLTSEVTNNTLPSNFKSSINFAIAFILASLISSESTTTNSLSNTL